MANWLTHLRIGQEVVQTFDFDIDVEKYYIGCIAADCGKVCFKDNGKRFYNPPRNISHWTEDISDWDRSIHYEIFYNQYIKNEEDSSKKSFYWGYYVHLLTDALWIELVDRPIIESFSSLNEFKSIAKKAFVDDWYHAELKFLYNTDDFTPLQILKSIKSFENIYLEYAKTEDVLEKIEGTLKMYQEKNIEDKTDFSYLTYDMYQSAIVSIKNIVKINIKAR